MTNDQAIDSKVISRLMKLRALAADGGANEHEANLAAEKFQQIMRDNNLTMASLEVAGVRAEGGERQKETQKGRAAYKYQQSLMRTIAKVNFVSLSVASSYNGKRWIESGYNMIGREANVIATRQLFDYLNGTAERLAFAYVGSNNRKRLSREAIAFKEGVSERLAERLQDRHYKAIAAQKAEARKANAGHESDGTALVLVLEDVAQNEADANADFQWGYAPGTTKAKRAVREAKYQVYEAALAAIRDMETPNAAELTEPARDAAIQAVKATIIPEGERFDAVEAAVKSAVDVQIEIIQSRAKEAKKTDKQRQAEREKTERANERYWRRHARENALKGARQRSYAYADGQEAGDTIGLDEQVDQAEAPLTIG